MVLIGMRRSEGWHAPVRPHGSEEVGWRMNETKMGVAEDAYIPASWNEEMSMTT